MDGVKAFLIFSAINSKTKGFIVCPCKKCCLGMTLREVVVYDHLTSGAGILEAGYTLILSVCSLSIYIYIYS
jgi:hypothetical protein